MNRHSPTSVYMYYMSFPLTRTVAKKIYIYLKMLCFRGVVGGDTREASLCICYMKHKSIINTDRPNVLCYIFIF